jgi:hypothetical protein
LQLEDLDEKVLQKKLDALISELNEYKARCERYKKENSWYRQEIEIAEKSFLRVSNQEIIKNISRI